jgi:hypothetical protein
MLVACADTSSCGMSSGVGRAREDGTVRLPVNEPIMDSATCHLMYA